MSDATAPKVLTPDDLAAADADRRVEPVDVPEWGGRVHVRELTALERGQMDEAIYDQEGVLKQHLLAPGLVAAALCGPDGRPWYKPGDMQAVLTVGSKSSPAVRRLYDVAAKLNRIRKEDAAEGKGDSAETAAGGSPSASPSPPAGPT